jgi:hypothetical protein
MASWRTDISLHRHVRSDSNERVKTYCNGVSVKIYVQETRTKTIQSIYLNNPLPIYSSLNAQTSPAMASPSTTLNRRQGKG